MKSKLIYRFSIVLSCLTLFLIFFGGLVKSTHSGLAVPDWPLSFGRLNPPMTGGIFYEHGHRLIAMLIGLLTITLALLITFTEERPWLRMAAWQGLTLVILQGVMGGLTVLLRLPAWTSIIHGSLGPLFLSLVVSITVWLSPMWIHPTSSRHENANRIPLHLMAAATWAACFIQLILGAVLRHSGWGLHLHITWAVIVLGLSYHVYSRLRKAKKADFMSIPNLAVNLALGTFLVTVSQILLGLLAYFLLVQGVPFIKGPFAPALFITFHVTVGSILLVLNVILTLWAYRTKAERLMPAGKKTLWADFFQLTKPGITLMAGLTTLMGFVLASKEAVPLDLLFHTGIGILMVTGGAGVLNMVFERETDAKMKRTKNRPIPTGRIATGEALFFGLVLSVGGVLYLAHTVNFLTAFLAGFTSAIYLYIYTPLKKRSAFSTMAGAVAGALPPVIGWAAATGTVTASAWILFGILFFWQFPHFFALAWLYREDYSAAGLHMLPQIKQIDPKSNGLSPAIGMVFNSILLCIVSFFPAINHMVAPAFVILPVLLGVALFVTSVIFLKTRTMAQARVVFIISILYLPIIVINFFLSHPRIIF